MGHWFPDYQDCDIDIVDYQQFTLPGCPVAFRGPRIDPFAAEEGSFFTCIGAAQTYGRLVERPFPNILAERTGLDPLNLSVGGAGPGFFLQHPSLVEAMNRGRFVILQCMSARQESNSRFTADGYVEYLKDTRTGDTIDSVSAWSRILDEEPDEAPRYLEETRESWLASSRKLVESIDVPVIFFWFSTRETDLTIDWDSIRSRQNTRPTSERVELIYGKFPHLVDRPTADRAAALCDATAHCVSDRGTGAVLLNRHTGKPIEPDVYVKKGLEYQAIWSGRNLYYPSTEMHEDAAATLQPIIDRFLR